MSTAFRVITVVACAAAALGKHGPGTRVETVRGGWVTPIASLDDGARFVFGTVVDATTRAPIPDALVQLTRGGDEQVPRTVTDEHGQFLFRTVPFGEYGLTASAFGYMEGGYGQLRVDGPATHVVVSAERLAERIELRLWKLGAIRGRIRDEFGEPLPGVTVRGLRLSGRSDGRSLVALTDDRGEYVLANVAPGHLIVAVPFSSVSSPVAAFGGEPPTGLLQLRQGSTPIPSVQVGNSRVLLAPAGGIESTALVGISGEEVTVRSTVYYPNSSSLAGAGVVVVRTGATRENIDLTVRAQPAVLVSGTVVGGTIPTTVRLRRTDTNDPSISENLQTDWPYDVARADTNARGQFTFVGVPPGEYALSVEQTRRGSGTVSVPAAWARVPLVVGSSDVEGVVVRMNDGLRVRGRVVIDSQEVNTSSLANAEVFLNSPGRNTVRAMMSTDGGFMAEGLLPGFYSFLVNVGNGLILGWVETGARRVTARAVELSEDTDDVTLIVTKSFGRIEGVVLGDPDEAGGIRALLFGADRNSWGDAGRAVLEVREVTVGQALKVSIDLVPPGDYFIVAVPDGAFDPRWRETSSLSRLAFAALRFRVGPTETKIVQVPVIRPG